MAFSAAVVAAASKHVLDELPEPVGPNLLVKLEVPPERTKGGIILMDQTRENEAYQAKRGVVVAMGPDCFIPAASFPGGPWCEVGDIVMFPMSAGLQVRVNDQEYRLMRDSSILGRFHGVR